MKETIQKQINEKIKEALDKGEYPGTFGGPEYPYVLDDFGCLPDDLTGNPIYNAFLSRITPALKDGLRKEQKELFIAIPDIEENLDSVLWMYGVSIIHKTSKSRLLTSYNGDEVENIIYISLPDSAAKLMLGIPFLESFGEGEYPIDRPRIRYELHQSNDFDLPERLTGHPVYKAFVKRAKPLLEKAYEEGGRLNIDIPLKEDDVYPMTPKAIAQWIHGVSFNFTHVIGKKEKQEGMANFASSIFTAEDKPDSVYVNLSSFAGHKILGLPWPILSDKNSLPGKEKA